MADVSQNFLKHYYISVSPENVAQFQENVAAWLKPYACEDEREEGGCVMEWEIRKALAGILKDGKVDRIEAPLLFDIADALDGLNTNDQILDAGEADTILYSPQIADPDDVLKLFQPDTARRDAVIGSLEEAKRLLTNTISSVERVRHRLLEDETSYLNFVSAQNLLGLSAWFSLDEALISPLEFTGAQFKFAPFSAIEFTGVRRVLQQLYAIRAGLLIFLEYYKSGIIYDRGQFVNAFLNSPFEIYAQTGHFLSGEISTDIEGRAPQYHLDFAAGMVRMAVDAKATKLAEHMRTVFVKTDNEYEQDYIDKPLPSLAFRLIDGPMISVCNYVVSLDDFIGLALGGVFGKVLAAVHKLYKAVKKIEKMIGHAKYILPGAAPFKTKPEETVLGWRGLKFMGNLAYEYFKGGLFIYGGHLIDEKDGAKWGARIYIFGLGSKVSFDSGYKTEAVKGILSGDKNSVPAMEVVEAAGDMSEADLLYLANGLARGSAVKVAPETLFGRIVEFSKNLERIADLHSRIDKAVQGAARFAAKNEGIIAGGFFDKVRKVAGDAASGADRTQLRDILKSIARLVSDEAERIADIKKAAQGTAVTGRRFSWSRIFGNGGRSKSGGGAGKTAQPKTTGRNGTATDAAPSLKEELLQNSPAALDMEAISRFTNGKVIVEGEKALAAIQRAYGSTPGIRRAFWRRLSELIGDRGRYGAEWKKIGTYRDGRWRGRVGEYRLLVVHDSDAQTFKIVEFVYRGKFKW